MIEDTILIRLCTTGFVHLYWGTSHSAIAAKYATITLLGFSIVSQFVHLLNTGMHQQA